MPTSDANGGNALQNIADVFTVAHGGEQLGSLPPQTGPFALREPTPDPISLTIGERVLETIETHIARYTHALRGITGASAFGKEQISFRLFTGGLLLPVVPDTPHARPPVFR
jgi:hypothetical protein